MTEWIESKYGWTAKIDGADLIVNVPLKKNTAHYWEVQLDGRTEAGTAGSESAAKACAELIAARLRDGAL